MLRFTHTLPKTPYFVAVSGGPDSITTLDFFCNYRIKPKVIYYDHGTEHSKDAEPFVREVAAARGLKFCVGRPNFPKLKEESKEEHWRKNRLHCFHCLEGPVITGHNLNDTIETWVWSSLHGESKLLPYRNGNVIRPFRATPKSEMIAWCKKNGLQYLDDPSNADTSYIRNHIRHKLMPEALVVNPGLEKVLLKKVLEDAKANP